MTLFEQKDVICTYTSEQATEDSILFNLDQFPYVKINSNFFLKYITSNLLSKGYQIDQHKINIPNITDLIIQAAHIFQHKSDIDTFISGTIELPSGQKQRIFIAQNETGRFTVKLPEDY